MNIIDSIINNQIYGGKVGNELNSNKLEKGGYSGTAQDLKDEIDLKQNITDTLLTTDTKTIVGAINELNSDKADLVNGKVPLSQMDDSLVGAVETGLYTSKIEQINFVEELKKIETPINLQFETIDSNKNFLVMAIYKNYGIGYSFTKTGDDYKTVGSVYYGELLMDDVYSFGKIQTKYTSKTGTWIDSTPSINGYSSEPGSTLTYDIINTKDDSTIFSRHQCRNDGGNFLIKIKKDGILIKEIAISTYSEISTKKDFTLLENAKAGGYQIVFEFTGGNTRGYTTSTSQNFIFFNEGLYKFKTQQFLTTPSNKDFAIEFKPDEAVNYEFMPKHSTFDICVYNEDPKFYIDNVLYEDFSYPQKKKCKEFKIIQNCNVFHPEVPSEICGTITAQSKLDKFGVLSFDGFFKESKKLKYKNGYTIMHVCKTDIFSYLKTGINNKYEFSDIYPTNIPMPKESDDTYNYCFFSEKNNFEEFAMACYIKNPRKTLRKYTDKKQKIYMTYMQNRDTNITKIYSNIFNGVGQTLENDCISWSGEYLYIKNPTIKIFKNQLE